MTVAEMSKKQKTEFNKLQKRLRRHVGKAIEDCNMIEEGDRVMVCLSGGKDSYGMLDILMNLRQSAPVNFELVAVNLDQKQPGFPEEVLPDYLSQLDIEYHILEKDTYSIVKSVVPEGKTTCGLCSRLRRGSLYGFAEQIGATKIALGHHRDDIIETLFLNMFFFVIVFCIDHVFNFYKKFIITLFISTTLQNQCCQTLHNVDIDNFQQR